MGRVWPIVPVHGDFAPWNLVEAQDRSIRALDWEYGDRQGFPGIDLAFFVLQTEALIHRTRPIVALRYAADAVVEELGVSPSEGFVIAQLAAYHAYEAAEEDGHGPTSTMQQWRRAAWEASWHD
jgi:thiamine kinase-like enzyme